MSKTTYEWIAEVVSAIHTPMHAEGDIIDCDHFETAAEMLQFMKRHPAQVGFRYEYGLVKDRLDDTDGLVERSWAYADEMDNLPRQFYDGSADTGKVPVRFKRELHKALWADYAKNNRSQK